VYSVKNKIELFNKMIYEKKKNEKEKEIKSLKENYEIKIQKLEKNQEEKRQEEIKKVIKESKKEKRQNISKAKVKFQKNLLEKHGEILNKFNKYINENIEKYLDTKDYKLYLEKEIDAIKKDIKEDDEVEIYIRKKDKDLMDLSNFKVEFTNDIIGGFYIIKNKNVKYDSTIKAKLEENSNYIGYLLKETLNNKEGVNFE